MKSMLAALMRLGAVLLLVTPPGVSAQEVAPQANWEMVSRTPGIIRLYAPESGAFLARTLSEFLRSDDGGVIWRVVPHPSDIRVMRVDPTNHDILYAAGVQKDVYKTTDGGSVWTRLLQTPDQLTDVWLSAADHDLVFVSLSSGATGKGLRLLRSPDGGSSWVELETHAGASCTMPLFEPYRANSRVIFRTFGCDLGRRGYNQFPTAQVSTDAGRSWAALSISSFAELLVGGTGTDPQRLYLASNGTSTGVTRGAWLARSDDGGKGWTTVLSLDTADPYDAQAAAFGAPIRGLAFDPAQPDHVFLSVGGANGGVRVSVDGGLAWSSLGDPVPGAIGDLALGIDGRYLFGATEEGVWRLDVVDGLPGSVPAVEAPGVNPLEAAELSHQ